MMFRDVTRATLYDRGPQFAIYESAFGPGGPQDERRCFEHALCWESSEVKPCFDSWEEQDAEQTRQRRSQ